jgi:alpha/beta superfamily hydrolase
MIYGKKDELVSFDHIDFLNKRLSNQKGIKVDFQGVEDANHFFSNKEKNLSNIIDNYIKKESIIF